MSIFERLLEVCVHAVAGNKNYILDGGGWDNPDPTDPTDPEPTDPGDPYYLTDLNRNSNGDVVFPATDRVIVGLGDVFDLQDGRRGDYDIRSAQMPSLADIVLKLTLPETFGNGLQIKICLFNEIYQGNFNASFAGESCLVRNAFTLGGMAKVYSPGTYQFKPFEPLIRGIDLAGGDELKLSNYKSDDRDKIVVCKSEELNTVKLAFYPFPADGGDYLEKI